MLTLPFRDYDVLGNVRSAQLCGLLIFFNFLKHVLHELTIRNIINKHTGFRKEASNIYNTTIGIFVLYVVLFVLCSSPEELYIHPHYISRLKPHKKSKNAREKFMNIPRLAAPIAPPRQVWSTNCGIPDSEKTLDYIYIYITLHLFEYRSVSRIYRVNGFRVDGLFC